MHGILGLVAMKQLRTIEETQFFLYEANEVYLPGFLWLTMLDYVIYK